MVAYAVGTCALQQRLHLAVAGPFSIERWLRKVESSALADVACQSFIAPQELP